MRINDTSNEADVSGGECVDSFSVPVWKRALDVTCIVLALPVVIPVALGLTILIKCVSPGSVLFLNERVGFRGRRFICFKFRTMKFGANSDTHQKHLAELIRSDVLVALMLFFCNSF